MNQDLSHFVTHARSKGMDLATIRMLLLSAGWKEKEVSQALTAESLDMPVPMPPDTGGAREAFFHLLMFVTLYTSVISLIVLFFTYIDRLFPDTALNMVPSSNDYSSIRWALAALVVSYPIFFFICRFLIKELRIHPEKAWSGVRRWLTYLTLFVTALALIGDVITLLFYFLQGDLTVRFIMKVLIILILTGLTFTYYFLSLRSSPSQKK